MGEDTGRHLSPTHDETAGIAEINEGNIGSETRAGMIG